MPTPAAYRAALDALGHPPPLCEDDCELSEAEHRFGYQGALFAVLFHHQRHVFDDPSAPLREINTLARRNHNRWLTEECGCRPADPQ